MVKPQIVSEYVVPGSVRFEYRDYAFRGPQAIRAAEAAACAADQGSYEYWRYHDTLFQNQSGANSFEDARLKQMAETLELDSAAFNECLDSGEKREVVEQSNVEAQSQGIDSTPSVFVNGIRVENWGDWNSVKQAIDTALATE